MTRSSALSLVTRWTAAINAGDVNGFLHELSDECVLVEPQHTYCGKRDLALWFETVVLHRASSLRILSAHGPEPDHVLAWAEWETKSFHEAVTMWTPLAVLTVRGRIREVHISPSMRVPGLLVPEPDGPPKESAA